ncbi:hypothetical protein D3C87_1902640 [compost metagenome]
MSAAASADCSALMRMICSHGPGLRSAKKRLRLSRASALRSGATESSRSKMIASQASERAFSSARPFMAGTLSTERRRRAGWLEPDGI